MKRNVQYLTHSLVLIPVLINISVYFNKILILNSSFELKTTFHVIFSSLNVWNLKADQRSWDYPATAEKPWLGFLFFFTSWGVQTLWELSNHSVLLTQPSVDPAMTLTHFTGGHVFPDLRKWTPYNVPPCEALRMRALCCRHGRRSSSHRRLHHLIPFR